MDQVLVGMGRLARSYGPLLVIGPRRDGNLEIEYGI